MGYILMYLDNIEVSKLALAKLVDIGDGDFDLYQTGVHLQPIVFNSQTCSETEQHCHGFVDEIACGRWDVAAKKRHLLGSYFSGYTAWPLCIKY